jgi:hypothetical protein
MNEVLLRPACCGLVAELRRKFSPLNDVEHVTFVGAEVLRVTRHHNLSRDDDTVAVTRAVSV